MRLRGKRFPWGERTFLMAIVNVTPDSFSGDGRSAADAAIEHALRQWRAGADMLDIGGESTRPGHTPVDARTEIARVVPVIEAVRAHEPEAIVSIDTYKPAVARAAHAAGADIVNSVLGAPPDLLDTAAELGMPLAAMHNQRDTHYDGDVVDAVVAYLHECAERAVARGIPRECVLLDPGIGFGKTADQNIRVLRHVDRICALGFPTLLGTSRKSTLGRLTQREPHERIYGTAATTALGIAAGIDVVRVHDVAANRDAIRVADAIVRDWRPERWTE
ncbi:MAG: dihydropteroate synthase [bacterium]|nr:dihydropteroate synthase [bacterium]